MLFERICFSSLFFVFGLQWISAKFLNRDCRYSCETGFQHTMCMPEVVAEDCENLKLTPASQMRDEVLTWHNLFRNEFAGGKPAGSGKSVGSVPNMRKMYWDDELEKMARIWASKCEPANDRCRKLPRFEVGQNVGLLISREHKDSMRTFIRWVNPGPITEDYFLQPGLVRSNPNTNRDILKRFFQIIWPGTYLIGCAEATYDDRSKIHHRLFVCNYGPSAFDRKVFEPIFSKAKPCSTCPVMTECPPKQGNSSHPLPNLCAIPSLEELFVERERVKFAGRILSKSAERRATKTKWSGERQLGVDPGEDSDETPTNDASDYCKLKCGDRHVMCQKQQKRKDCCLSKMVIGSELEKDVLPKFNKMRNDVAGGKVAHLLSASNMRVLEWDEELAELATRWAASCPMQKDSCRDTATNHVSQIVVIGSSSSNSNISMAATSVENIMSIADTFPLQDLCAFQISDQDPHPSPYSYLSQLMWAKTSRIGCAEVLYGLKSDGQSCGNGPQYSSLVCNFAEGGNVLGRNIYKLGEPCTNCPQGTGCSDKHAYPNLCYDVAL